MQALNFPRFDFRFKKKDDNLFVFDIIRKKYVLLQPEEWVRQHVVHFLLTIKGYPETLMNVEKQLVVNNLPKRYDVVVFNSDGSIFLLVECKAPQVKITQDVFDQIARYNQSLGATYLMVTNGTDHYYCQMDYTLEKYMFLKEIPDFK